MTRARGLDLSSCQGSVDFAKVRAAGFSYVILKCTQGGTIDDPTWAHRCIEARQAGLLVGAYHFLTTTSAVSAQIARCLSRVTPFAPELGVFVDFEYPPPEEWRAHGESGDTLVSRALAMCQGLEAAGVQRVTVYTYPYFARALPFGEPLLDLCAYGLWIASYKDEKNEPASDIQRPDVPIPWDQWRFWQWSGDKGGPAPGVPQVVDHDVYNGTEQDLHAWARDADRDAVTVPDVTAEVFPGGDPDDGPAAA